MKARARAVLAVTDALTREPFKKMPSSPFDCRRYRDQRRPERRPDQWRTEQSWDQRRNQLRRRTSKFASSGRRYFRATVIVIVNELSNKQLRLIRNPRLFVTEPRTRDNIFYCCQCKWPSGLTLRYRVLLWLGVWMHVHLFLRGLGPYDWSASKCCIIKCSIIFTIKMETLILYWIDVSVERWRMCGALSTGTLHEMAVSSVKQNGGTRFTF
jgi:hypothetical protein